MLKVVPSQAAVRQRDAAIRSYAKMQETLARGAGDDTSGHLGERTTLHKREEAKRSKAVDAGFLILKEVGPLSPRFADMFPEGGIGVDLGIKEAMEDIILNGVEPQTVINHAAEIWRLFEWLKSLNLKLDEITELRIAGYIRNSSGRGRSVPGRVRNAVIWLREITSMKLGAEN